MLYILLSLLSIFPSKDDDKKILVHNKLDCTILVQVQNYDHFSTNFIPKDTTTEFKVGDNPFFRIIIIKYPPCGCTLDDEYIDLKEMYLKERNRITEVYQGWMANTKILNLFVTKRICKQA